jgi:uncharacterized protein YndB with AHSA1/START domain
VQDSIERSIDIDAPAATVWALISRPGWWINDGEITELAVERKGDLDVVTHPEHGTFPIRTEKLDEPRYAAFRWFSATVADDSTLTEFQITDRPGGGVTLTVTESGFASLSGTAQERRTQFEGNVRGWEQELDVAKRYVER